MTGLTFEEFMEHVKVLASHKGQTKHSVAKYAGIHGISEVQAHLVMIGYDLVR